MENTSLMVIDMQKGFDDHKYWGGERNNNLCEQNVASLISRFRKLNLPIIHIKHNSLEEKSPLRPENEGNDYKKEALPLKTEKQFSKNVNSAFIGTNLEEYLKEKNINNLSIVGLTTDHCVSTTTRMASNLGFNVRVVSDATATFNRMGYDGIIRSADEMHKINLTSLHKEFCTVVSTQQILDELN